MNRPAPENFQRTINGRQTSLYTISNDRGIEVFFSNYGARIIALLVNGVNVTPMYPSLESYMSPAVAPYHGATVGRYANRIARGAFTLNGQLYQLPVNNPPNHLHGGTKGFHNQVWEIQNRYQNSIVFSYLSVDGEEGYPGDVNVSVSYTISMDNEMMIEYTAAAKAASPFNLTNHAFFNLNGEGSILDHQLQINADYFTPVDASLIPTGERKEVRSSAFDFREMKTIGKDIENDEEQLRKGGGYDHNFILNKEKEGLTFAAKATGDKSGITMEVFTEEPGLQLFSGNFEAVTGDPTSFRTTFCLETQHFPDSPNQPGFPTTILEAGDTFSSLTVYKFTTRQ